MGDLAVKELTPSLRDDFLFFFDNVAFADNPDWSDCYCPAYHFANKGKAESRRQASTQVEDGRIHGFLAYDNGKPVGWCNAANRYSYPGIPVADGPRSRQGRKNRFNRLLRYSILAPQQGNRHPTLHATSSPGRVWTMLRRIRSRSRAPLPTTFQAHYRCISRTASRHTTTQTGIWWYANGSKIHAQPENHESQNRLLWYELVELKRSPGLD